MRELKVIKKEIFKGRKLVTVEDENIIYYIFMGSKYFPLDNFYPDVEVQYEGLTYRNSEAAFQSAKLVNKEDRLPFTTMGAATSKFTGKNPYATKLRPDWNEIKDQVMYDIVKDKMLRNPWIKDLLLNTGNKIIEEGNTWNDLYWGVDIETREGNNQLGKTLMRLRDEFRG